MVQDATANTSPAQLSLHYCYIMLYCGDTFYPATGSLQGFRHFVGAFQHALSSHFDAQHLNETGPSTNIAQDVRVAALPAQPSVCPAPLPPSAVVSSINVSEMMHSIPVPSSFRTASQLPALWLRLPGADMTPCIVHDLACK